MQYVSLLHFHPIFQDKRSSDAGELLETTDSLVETVATQNIVGQKNVRTENIGMNYLKI